MDKNLGINISFLGAGQMATALAKGILASGLATPAQLRAVDVSEASRKAFVEKTGATLVDDPAKLIDVSDVIILAVKPFHAVTALKSLQSKGKSVLLISIAAGLTLEKLAAMAGSDFRIIRVMPNTPALVACGASGFCPAVTATAKDLEIAEKILASIGIAYRVEEYQMDAVTGLSGSAPAFVYMMIEALSDGGVAAGLPRQISTKLAAQTVLGAARMVLETGLHPGALKDMVTSPAGTTIEGVQKLEESGMRAAFIKAVRAAADRSNQLGK